MQKNILFLTGTRADFGKIKTLITELSKIKTFSIHVFVTGMHMLKKYGYTCIEVDKLNIENIFKYINQRDGDPMEIVLANTIQGLSNYIHQNKIDMMVIHGDRVEALAGAIVGAMNNIITTHIEGGEVSGTVDELIRHAVTKLSHLHFVANKEAANRIKQLGEVLEQIHIIGSPDIDVMNSERLPSLKEVRSKYEIEYDEYAILLYHPVTTELDKLSTNVNNLLNAIVKDGSNYVVIYPNNDSGTEIILNAYKKLECNKKIKIYPSMRFEYFLTLLKNAKYVIGNSSAGIREAPHYGVPAVNIGTRQYRREINEMIINSGESVDEILNAIRFAKGMQSKRIEKYGDGNSAEKFVKVLQKKETWNISCQKYFIDY